MIFFALLILTGLAVAQGAAPAAGELRPPPNVDRFEIELPTIVLRDVPIRRVTIRAVTKSGEVATTYHGQPEITGIALVQRDADGMEAISDNLGNFQGGVLTLETDIAKGRRVYISDTEVVVKAGRFVEASRSIIRIPGWMSLVPPLLAIGLAIYLKDVNLSLFLAVLSGGVLLAHGNLFIGFIRTLDTYLLQEIVQKDGGTTHILIVLFTMFLGAMIAVMSRSGGTEAIVLRMSRITQTREHGQLVTWLMGLVIFFDDYANTFLVGGTMRPITDRLKISREKLAFLVDSTAAPVAGLALISTWIGFEVGQIQKAYSELGIQESAYQTFVATIPYRLYPVLLLSFVGMIAWTGRDFGPMLKAERRALHLGQPFRDGASIPDIMTAHSTPADAPPHPITIPPSSETVATAPIPDISPTLATKESTSPRLHLANGIVPIATLLTLVLIGLYWTGHTELAKENSKLQESGSELIPITLWAILGKADSNRVLFLSSFTASLVALILAVLTKSLRLPEAAQSWVNGAKAMLTAVMILILAWGLATVCDESHLNTAGFLIERTHGSLSIDWLPLTAFLLGCGVSFSTGSSFTTMGLLTPLFVSLAHYLLLPQIGPEATGTHVLMYSTVGGVFAGALFGDHCSPISDTTVLSSAGSACDHLDHVRTQMPYALTVAGVSILFGYVPIGLGFTTVSLLLPLGILALAVIVRFVGRHPREMPFPEQTASSPLGGPST